MENIINKNTNIPGHNHASAPDTVSHATKLMYGLGAFGYGSTGQTMNSFLMFFGTCILGIPGILMGIAVGIGTVWDAVTDPIVGYLSDNTKSRIFGKRHGFILFAGIAVAIINIMIWSISPNWPIIAKFACLLTLLIIIETFNTLYSTPYGALGLDMGKTYDERTAIQSYKTIFSFLSLLVPSILMSMFLSPTDYITMTATNRGYINIALVTSSLCVICGVICFIGTYSQKSSCLASVPIKKAHALQNAKTKLKNNHTSKTREVFSEFFNILKQKNIGLLITGYAVSLSAGAFITTLGLHVFTYSFGFSTTEIPIIMICLIGGIVLGQPLWYHISRKYDKVSALISALFLELFAIIMFAVVFALRNAVTHMQILPFVCGAIFVCGMGTGCLHSIPISMYADCIYKDIQQTHIDNTAKSAGFLTFCTKISNAVIMFIIGVSLDIIGFKGSTAIQSLSTQNWLGWLLILGVSVACISAVFIYNRYTYDKNDFT